jgi:hypothetical protein
MPPSRHPGLWVNALMDLLLQQVEFLRLPGLFCALFCGFGQ